MEPIELSPKINISNLSGKLENDSIYIPIKTIKNYIFASLYDFSSNKIIDQIFSNNYYINSINKILMNNIIYLHVSLNRKDRFSPSIYENTFFTIKDGKLKKEENSLSKCLEEDIQKIIILDNKDVVALRNRKKISYYIYNNSNYKKLFNNLNKGDYIFGLIKLSKNNFCYLSANDPQNFKFTFFDENFITKEKEIKMLKPIYNIRNNNIIFKINKEKVIIIGKFEYIIFDPILLEIQTIISTGLICGVFPFNKENNDYDEKYHYFALITFENDNFYLKIYSIFDYIKETEKINLNQLSPDFEKLIFDNNIRNVYKIEEEK